MKDMFVDNPLSYSLCNTVLSMCWVLYPKDVPDTFH